MRWSLVGVRLALQLCLGLAALALAVPALADNQVVTGTVTDPITLGSGDWARIRSGGVVDTGGTGGDAIFGDGTHTVWVERGARVHGAEDGIALDRGTIFNWGFVNGGESGVEFDEFGTLYNWGTVKGNQDGVFLDDGFNRTRVFNWGLIEGGDGIDADEGGGYLEVRNWGTIRGDSDDGIELDAGIIFNFGQISTGRDGNEGIEFDEESGTVYNWGRIESWGLGDDDSGIEFDFDGGPGGHARVFNLWYGQIRSANGSGVELEENDRQAGARATIANFGRIEGRFGIRLEDDTRIPVDTWNFGVIRGREASILLDLADGDAGNLKIKGTGTFFGAVRAPGPNDTLRLDLQFVPKEDISRLLALQGASGPKSYSLSNGRLAFSGFEHVIVDGLLSGELEATGGLEDFGRSLDWTRVTTIGAVPELLGGLAMEAGLGNRRLNEAFETVSGRAQHHMQSDNAFQVATQLSIVHQRYFDRVRERRRHGFHGGTLAMRMDSGIASELSAITGKQYASARGVVLGDVIDERDAGEAPAPRRRPEPAAQPAPAPAPAVEEPVWGGFLSGIGVFGDQDHTGSRVNGDYVTAGATLGVDRELAPGLIGGLLLGYLRTDADVDGKGSELDDDEYAIGPYLSWGDASGWHASASAIYGYHDYEAERFIQLAGFDLGAVSLPGLVISANSRPSGHQFTSYASGGYDWHTGPEGSAWTVGPYAALQFSLLHVPDYEEYGAGALDLNYDDQTAHSLQTHLGVRLNREITCDLGTFVPELRALWGHEFMDDDRNIRTHFDSTDIPRFTVSTRRADRDFGIVGAALTGTLERWRNVHFFAGYDARIGQDDFLGHTANAGVWIQF
jgi:uncharacterized protein YhjY with autotransporter beta-barrel domain